MSSSKITFKKAERLSRVGEYYFSKKLAEIARMKEAGVPILNLGIGSPDLPPAPEVIETLAHSSSLPDNHGYQSYRGIPELRAAFAEWYQRFYQVAIDPDREVLPLIGSKEGIMHIAMSFLEEGDFALVPDPGYPSYASATRLAGATPLTYDLKPERNWMPDFEALEQLDLDSVRIMWLNYPHMPSGTRGNKALFQRLVQFARKHEILLVHDNPYSFILNDPCSLLAVEGASEVVLEMNSLSKSHNMAGWRIGALFGNEELLQTVLRFKSNMDSGQFKPMQLASVKALQLSESWYTDLNEIYRSRRKVVHQLLDLLNCHYKRDQAGMFVWARVPEWVSNGFEFSDHLLQETALFITPGGIFGEQGNAYIRISLCSEETVFREAIHRVEKLAARGKKMNSSDSNSLGIRLQANSPKGQQRK
ncbi:MAG: aminotransferase class I/II-fold pyridoxal phosphate-dependent enzyme [Bacteroidetes bacterium]|nr:aminotransferase class I/II-fold pyridoxal phosphate-dependent enzyme [Bacteroidota bacterium]